MSQTNMGNEKKQKTIVLGSILVFTAVTSAMVFLSTTYPALFTW